MQKAELQKMPAADLPERIPGTDHIRIPLLFAQIESSNHESPLIRRALDELETKYRSKLSLEQAERLDKLIRRREEYFKAQAESAQKN